MLARPRVPELADPGDRELCLVATGSYLGEGFDCPYLDTLFLAFPLAFKGRIVQYVGRLLRLTDKKQDVEVHDYVDVRVPVSLARTTSVGQASNPVVRSDSAAGDLPLCLFSPRAGSSVVHELSMACP